MIVPDHAVGPASGIDLAGLWHAFAHAEDGLYEDDYKDGHLGGVENKL